MLTDPNVERCIENAIMPLRKEIETLKVEIEELKQSRQADVSGSVSIEKCNSCGRKKVELIHRCKCGVEW